LTVRRCAKTVKTGGTPTGAGDEYFSSPGFDWFTPGDFNNKLCLGISERQLSQVGKDNIKIFPPNTVMMIGIGATIGKVAICKNSAGCNQQINGIVLNEKVDVEFFALFLRSLREYIVACGKFTTIPIINQDGTKSLPVLVPPIEEQKQIVEQISSQASSIDTAIGHAHREVALLREYRTRLIADVVTGKLDVREAAQLPDEVDEAEPLDDVEETADNVTDDSVEEVADAG
jgi:type I restriction enzyme S subunit